MGAPGLIYFTEACLVDIIQCRRLMGVPTYIVFIDIKMAYDTVPHGALLPNCPTRELGVDA